MKFFTKAISLIAVTSLAVASPVANSKRGMEEALNCQKAYTKLSNECRITITKTNNYNETCKTYNQPQCYKLYQEGPSSIPECKNVSEQELPKVADLISGILSIVAIQCEVDEKGDFCPIAVTSQKAKKENKEVEHSELIAVTKESCKSKKCKDAYTNIFSKLDHNKAVTSGQENIKDILEILKSDTCAPAGSAGSSGSAGSAGSSGSAGSAGNASSDASTTMKYSSVLFVMVGLLLNALF